MVGKVTLKELSAKAGVSIATVSRAINNPDSVKRGTLEKIHNAMDEMNKKSNIIAFVVPDLANMFFPMLLKGIEAIARMQGISVIVCNSEGNPNNEDKILSNLIELGVDGIIFICSGSSSPLLKDIVSTKRIPIVFLDRKPGLKNTVSVTSDNYEGMYQAASYLTSLGHRRILYLGGPGGVSTEEERYKGFCAAIEDKGILMSEISRYEGNYQSTGVYEFVKETLAANPKRFTAICASNDLMAHGAYQAIIEGHYSVPSDYSIIGYDDIPSSALLQLTTIKQPFEEMGRTAVMLLLSMIKDPDVVVNSRVLSTGITIRKSCQYLKS